MKYINKMEYDRLCNEDMINPIFWNLHEDILINNFINNIFEENKFFFDIFFYSDYNILKYDSKISNIHFDHYYSINLKYNVSHISDYETITGIINFPYVSWDEIEDYLCDIPQNWSLFIINPILMKYSETIGIFLTPTYANDFFIEECNNFIQSKTGFPFFLSYTNNPDVPKIIFDKPLLNLKNYVKEAKKTANKGLCKLLDFWADNDCVSVSSFEYSFDDYKDDLYFLTWEDIDLKDIQSTIPFQIVHEDTGEILGVFKRFNLDKAFNLAYGDTGAFKLSNSQVNDLIDGKYDFKLVRLK